MGFCSQKPVGFCSHTHKKFCVIRFTETAFCGILTSVHRNNFFVGFCSQQQTFCGILFTEATFYGVLFTETKFQCDSVYRNKNKFMRDCVYRKKISAGICLQKQNFDEILLTVRKLLNDYVHKYRISAGICSNKQTLWKSIHRSTISAGFLFSQKKHSVDFC